MAKIYGTPIMAGGSGGMNKDLPPLLDNFKASVPLEGIPVKDMPVGTKIKVPVNADYQSFLGENIVWLVADQNHEGYPENSSTLITEKIIALLCYDAAEPTNADALRKQYGNNRYIYSNVQQWLNSNAEPGHWYSEKHAQDAPPSNANVWDNINPYDTWAGFLAMINDDFAAELMTTDIAVVKPSIDGGSYETFAAKIFLASTTEVGLANENGVAEGSNLALFSDDTSRIAYCTQAAIDKSNYVNDPTTSQAWYWWLRTPRFSSSLYARMVFTSGALSDDNVYDGYRGIRPLCNISNETLLSHEPDSDGCYTLAELAPMTIAESDNYSVTLSADKMEESRAEQLAGAVWVYGDHSPANVNDGTKIQLTREECITPSLEGEDVSVNRAIPWSKTKDFYARQFTYNSKKQYQTMLEGALASVIVEGAPEPVSELAEQHSGSSITLTWKNPTSDELYDHTVVVYKTDAFPTSIDDGTQGYTGTDETATLSDLELGTTYYIAVFTVSYIGVYGQPETIQVEIPAGKLLSSLASGTKVKLGKWNNTDLQWKVARDTSDQSIRLVLEPTSVSLLGSKQYDAPEPSNSDGNRKSYGNNRYIYSNIHQWLNATKASNWYTAQHSADAAPAYSSSPGFLSGWSENHINALDNATLTTSRASVDGGGTETFVARVALISTTELGLQNSTGGGRLDIFSSDGDRATGSLYWTRTPYPSGSCVARLVAGTGGLISGSVYGAIGVRPLCIPVSTALVSLEMDDDNCYVVQ